MIRGECFLFLKPEHNGLGTWSQAVNHGVDFLYSRVVGECDDGKKRKERVGSVILEREDGLKQSVQDYFLRLATEVGINEADATAAARLGISWMLAALQSHQENAASEQQRVCIETGKSVFEQKVMKALDMQPVQCQEEFNFKYRIGAEVFVPNTTTQQILDRLPIHIEIETALPVWHAPDLYETLREEIQNRDEDMQNLKAKYKVLLAENDHLHKHCKVLEDHVRVANIQN